MSAAVDGCGAPEQSAPIPASVDIEKETVISGVVSASGEPVAGAYVRLLDSSGEFTAEVVASPRASSASSRRPARGRYGPCPAPATASWR